MTNEKKSEFYLVREEILPEAIKKNKTVKQTALCAIENKIHKDFLLAKKE